MQPSVCVCLSVFFLTDATHPLGTPGPAGAGPWQLTLFLKAFPISLDSLQKSNFNGYTLSLIYQ